MDHQPPPRHLDFKVIARDLDELLTSVENTLEREAGRIHPMALGYFAPGAKIIRNTWKTIQYFCADSPPDDTRKREFSLSAAPLNRSILDIIFNSVFLLEDVETRLLWFAKAGWREQKIEYDRLKSDFGHLPEFRDWLECVYGRLLSFGAENLPLTQEELGSPLLIRRWPNPGSLISYGLKSGDPLPSTRHLMRRLNEIYYADLSQQAHLSFQGFVKRASYFAPTEDDQRREVLETLRQEQIFTSLTLLFLFASIVDEYFALGLDSRIRYLWTLIGETEDRAKLVYSVRYERPLFTSL